MKRFLFCMLMLFVWPVVASEQCQKPVLTTYQPVSKQAAPLENVFYKDLSFYTAMPDRLIAPSDLTILIYKTADKDSEKIINYFTIYQDIDGYSPRDLYAQAFGYEDIKQDKKAVLGVRTALKLNCKNSNYQQIRLDNVDYRVILSEKQADTGKNDVFIIPNDPQRKVVYFLQFKNFSMDEIGAMLSTIDKERN